MSVCGSSRPCSGGCHEISHALDDLHPGLASHGEQVGLGALFCTWLRGETARFPAMAGCLTRHGLPTRPSDLRLTGAEFAAAVAHAPRTRPDRYTILEHLDLSPAQLTGRVADYGDALDALGH
jgi:glycerol-1-phosphate dehydrogenase [NAD(P)+]